MSSNYASDATTADTTDTSRLSTSGYMLSVKVSTHPAFYAEGADADAQGTTAYNFTVNTTPAAPDGTVITLTYYHGTTDITSTVDTYFLIVASGGGCTTATPSSIPTSVSTVNGTSCYTFEKQSGYTSDHTFTINASSTDATNSPTTAAF